MKKQNWFINFIIFISIIFSSFLFCDYSDFSFPILDPSDPIYNWMDELIEKDFTDNQPQQIDKTQFEEALEFYKNNETFQHFIVHNNQVTGINIKTSAIVDFNHPFLELLTHLCKYYGLPNLELIWYSHDGLDETQPVSVPIFSICRRKGIKNVVLCGHPYGLNWVDIQCKSVDAIIKNQEWNQLIPHVYWRGNCNDGHSEYAGGYTAETWMLHPRGKTCWISQQYPHLVNAAFVLDHYFGIHYLVERNPTALKFLTEHVLPTAPHASYEDALEYRYQLLLPGVRTPWSSDWKIHAGRVIFQYPMPWETYWESLFIPWKHYIPIKEDFSDFTDNILWAAHNDPECRMIAIRSVIFMRTHARAEHMALYCYKVLLRYEKILNFS